MADGQQLGLYGHEYVQFSAFTNYVTHLQPRSYFKLKSSLLGGVGSMQIEVLMHSVILE
jgi:hypothetical protein